MTPTPPSPEDDILDLSGLTAPSAKSKASTQESDFEKELEALFAEDLAQTEAAAAAKAPAASAPAPAAPQDEDALLLQDILGEAAADLPLAAPAAAEEDVLDLSAFAAQEEVPAAAVDDGDDVLDLSAFATDGPLDLTPPPDMAGGKDGDIDIAGLDSLISDLGDGAQTIPPVPEPVVLQPADGPLDDIDIHGLDDVLNVPKAAGQPAAPEADTGAQDLSLGDLLDEAPAEGVPAASEDVLDLTLPDLSEPEPGAVLSALDDTPPSADAEAEALAAAALSMVDEDLNLSMPTDMAGEPRPGAMNAEDILGVGDLEMAGIMEGFEAHMPEVASEAPMDAGTLLDQVDAEAVLGAAAAGAVAGAVVGTAAAEPSSPVILTPQVLDDLQKMLTELRTQVLGGSVTVVGMQGQLAEKDQVIAAMEERLRSAEAEATALREELSALRGALEEDGRTSTQVKERLALLEDRQAQMDQDMRAEIERAVPREAAKVIREEIAALAESMRD